VTNFALQLFFKGSANIMEKGGGAQNIKSGIHEFSDIESSPVYPAGVIRTMASPLSIPKRSGDVAETVG
jgi:hypothetical protein